MNLSLTTYALVFAAIGWGILAVKAWREARRRRRIGRAYPPLEWRRAPKDTERGQ